MPDIRHDPDDTIQRTQITDDLGNPVSVTGNKLDINATITGGATSANQTNGSQKTQIVDSLGANIAEFPLPVAQVATLTPPAAITGFATSALQLPDGHNVTVDNLPADYPLPTAQQTILSSIAGFNIPAYDYIGAGYPGVDTETYTFKEGGSGGTTVGTLTIVYTDATKTVLTSVTKS